MREIGILQQFLHFLGPLLRRLENTTLITLNDFDCFVARLCAYHKPVT